MRKVLVLEDEQVILDILDEFLSKNEFEVIRASRGNEALDIIKSRADIDLLVVDLMMPGAIKGAEVVKEIKKIGIDLPAIAITGSPYLRKHSLDLECSQEDILLKPLDLQKLLGVIRRKLAKKS